MSDPVGALLQYGIAWLIEHVQPLSDVIDRLAGDPAQIAAHAQTWRNVASALTAEAGALAGAVRTDVAEWSGAAAGAYRAWAAQREQSLRALSAASETMALITEVAGALIGTVRTMVRDAVATVVSRLAVYAGELIATAGLAAPLVAEQVATLCASWAARIGRWLHGLIASLRKLTAESGRLAALIGMLKRALGSGGRGGGLTTPSGPPRPDGAPSGDRTPAHPTRKKDRALRRENDAADTLARNGYDVEQNPPPRPNGKAPDYRIEGEYFDCYAPHSPKLDTIRDAISDKVSTGQAGRIVLNLDDSPRSADEVADVLRRKPIAGLEQILVVEDGRVVPLYPFDQ